MSEDRVPAASETTLLKTPLNELHRSLGAKMVPFAGYDMPVQYTTGILAEHTHARTRCSLFDVSHMGQVTVHGPRYAAALETLVPADIVALAAGQMRYTMLTNETGGIRDDIMVTNAGDHLFVVVNASRKVEDIAYLKSSLAGHRVNELADRALIALQGPAAAVVIARVAPGAERLSFMHAAHFVADGIEVGISRSGYTGEDGFELSVPSNHAERIARRLLAEPEVSPAGLGARDTLRLEAGLCLYGHDIDETTTPVEAGLLWTIGKRRRAEGGYPGAGVVNREIANGPKRRRVGLAIDGRAPAREGAELTDRVGRAVGRVTSGGFGPSVGGPIAMGYVEAAAATPGNEINAVVRDVPRKARIQKLPFVAHRYHKG
jgi:aminomethyltransferase